MPYSGIVFLSECYNRETFCVLQQYRKYAKLQGSNNFYKGK